MIKAEKSLVDEMIEIAYLGENKYSVTGLNGTRVNPTTSTNVVENVTRNIIVDMKKGMNSVSILGTGADPFYAPGNLTIKGGAGVDEFAVKNANIVGKLTVSSGGGNDKVRVDPTSIGKDVSISTGEGIDGVWLEKVTIGTQALPAKLTVSTGSGNDRVGIADSKVWATSASRLVMTTTKSAWCVLRHR